MDKIFMVRKLMSRVLYSFNKFGIPNFNDDSAEFIIWAPHFFTLRFLVNDNLQKCLSIYILLKNSNRKVTLYTKNDIGKFKDKVIFYYGSHQFNIYSFSNYMDILSHISHNLEAQNNKVFPSSYEVSLWENKSNMHKIFDEKDVKSPQSKIINLTNPDLNLINSFRYPALIKEEHSCSSLGIYKVNSPKDVYAYINDKHIRINNSEIILQELLEMRKDLRVILVGNKIIWHYWRINLDKEWKPTATGYGSKVDFENFPEKWRDWIIQEFLKLNITTGAFDIAWQNDDLESEPYILEVSPFYQPNPKPRIYDNLVNYGHWKKTIGSEDNYQKAVVDLIFNIQEQFLKEFLTNEK